MDDDGDGIYSVTIETPAGDIEYKYGIDGFADQENLIDDMQNGASCAPVTDYNGYANRLATTNDTYGRTLSTDLEGCIDETAAATSTATTRMVMLTITVFGSCWRNLLGDFGFVEAACIDETACQWLRYRLEWYEFRPLCLWVGRVEHRSWHLRLTHDLHCDGNLTTV